MNSQSTFNPERRIAMLIDGDNAQHSLLKQMFEEASRYGEVTDLPPVTRPLRVRAELALQRQPGANSPSCYADDDDCTPDATVG